MKLEILKIPDLSVFHMKQDLIQLLLKSLNPLFFTCTELNLTIILERSRQGNK